MHALPRRPAFTLVELLVVIGIVALLLAILLPTIGRIREAGYKTVCLGNLRQLGAAVSLYAADHRGYTPGSNNRDANQPPGIPNDEFPDSNLGNGPFTVYTNPPDSQGRQLNPRNYNVLRYLDATYAQGTGAYLCPAMDASRGGGTHSTDADDPHQNFRSSYGIVASDDSLKWRSSNGGVRDNYVNDNIFGHVVNYTDGRSQPDPLFADTLLWPRLVGIKDHTRRLSIADAGDLSLQNPNSGFRAWMEIQRGKSGHDGHGAVNPRHGDLVNWVALDGSAHSDTYDYVQQPTMSSNLVEGWNVLGQQ